MSEDAFAKRYYQLPRGEIGHLRFILESYDGLCFARTLDNQAAVVEIAYHPSRASDADALLKSLAAEINLHEIPAPDQVLPL